MYYFCWYTMMEESFLERFGFPCKTPVQHPTDDPNDVYGIRNDYRMNDTSPFDCAMLNFCPGQLAVVVVLSVCLSSVDWTLPKRCENINIY